MDGSGDGEAGFATGNAAESLEQAAEKRVCDFDSLQAPRLCDSDKRFEGILVVTPESLFKPTNTPPSQPYRV
jgi:hypothetical protein